MQERIRKEKETEKENYLSEIKAYHDEAAKEMLSYRLRSIGNQTDNSVFCYETTYTMNNLVKKAGPNYILSMGKLLGCQLKLEKQDRNRTADIHTLSPRTYKWTVEVKLPSGYQVPTDGLKKQNTQTENECGCFTVKATCSDNILRLQVTKKYACKMEDKSRWPKLCEIIDAAQHYESASIVLRK